MPISILGINYINSEGGTPSVTAGIDLPWLQDVPAQNVWFSWVVGDKDIVILDGGNFVFKTFNANQKDLGIPENYDQLRAFLLDAAAAE